MGLPSPQFNTPLAPNQVNPELAFYPIYGVTPSDKWTPISITENGQLSIGSVTISGPVTISDVVIKGVDPDNSFVSEDVDVFNLGAGNGWSMRTTPFDGANHLKINNDGSINTSISGSVSISNFPATQNVDVTNASIPVTQSGSWTVSLSSGSIEIGTVDQGAAAALSGAWPVKLTDGAGNLLSSTSGALDVNVKSTTNGPSTSANTSISRSGTNQTFLVANPNRKGATIYNNSSALLYVLFGANATTSSFTVRLATQSYYEVPFNYLGRIDGIWTSAGAGTALISELA
jgi:hypothetical protein